MIANRRNYIKSLERGIIFSDYLITFFRRYLHLPHSPLWHLWFQQLFPAFRVNYLRRKCHEFAAFAKEFLQNFLKLKFILIIYADDGRYENITLNKSKSDGGQSSSNASCQQGSIRINHHAGSRSDADSSCQGGILNVNLFKWKISLKWSRRCGIFKNNQPCQILCFCWSSMMWQRLLCKKPWERDKC